jgi:hypothetical protein
MCQVPIRYFIFHNAGQGLFYSGKINGFEFVYDCGSIRKQHLTNIVLDYKRTLPNEKLNLLVLSHLHEDHVSGLHAIFHRNPKTSVERVILPYLSPTERLILAIRPRPPPENEWYYDFLSDPVRFFVERGVQRIIYIGGTEQTQQTENPANRDNPETRDNERPDRLEDKLKDSIVLREIILAKEPHLSQYLKGRALQVKTHDGALMLSAHSIYWQFRFYNYGVKPETLVQFENCVKNITNDENFSEIITDEQKRESLRCCYQSLNKTDFNNTSLLLLHGPPSNQQFMPLAKQTQLLTGDISFKQRVPDISRHFGSDLSDVGWALIPHHGSKRNWDKTILSHVPRGCTWVASTGKANRHQPCLDIFKDIKSQGQAYAICNDDIPFSI